MPSPTKTPKKDENPYIAARREWNERYGDYIHQAKTWRSAAFASLALAALALLGCIYEGSRAKLIPYFVKTDSNGDIESVQKAAPTTSYDPNVVKAQLVRFLTDWRSVVGDYAVEKHQIDELYSMVSNGSPSAVLINGEMQKHDPFQRSQNELVSIAVTNLLPLSNKTFQIDWTEQVHNRKGELTNQLYFRASLTIAFSPPQSEEQIYKNPIGLYVTDLSYAPILK